MPDFTGFQPQVGEIRALRTFRIGPSGRLFPLFDDRAWSDEINTARCTIYRAGTQQGLHVAPEPDCTCGFYAYGTETAAGDYPHTQHVLGVVACWGKVIAGTRGIRAEHARLEAIWMSEKVPVDLVREVHARYPNAIAYTARESMLNRHPPTAIDSYQIQSARPTGWRTSGPAVAITSALIVGLAPAHWLGAGGDLLWTVQFGLLLLAAIMTCRGRKHVAAANQRRLVLGAAIVWFVAPMAGLAGWLFIRIPMVEVFTLVALARRANRNAARQFPARIGGSRRSPQSPRER